MLPDLLAGVYRHYKGPLYLVLGMAHDANADELFAHRADVARSSTVAPSGDRIVVVYIGLQLDEAHTGPRLAVRTLEDFMVEVCGAVDDEGAACGGNLVWSNTLMAWTCVKHGETINIKRFSYLGPSWEGE